VRARRLLLVLGGILGVTSLHWFFRPNRASVNADIVLETWEAVADGTHNSNTDLTYWNGSFYLIHQTSPYHTGSTTSRLLLWRSPDARRWEKITEFKAERGEYRDPKFAAIGEGLFLYVLPNHDLLAEPSSTAYTYSTDGTSWQPMEETEPRGWLFWRPKTRDGSTWYVPAYWHEHGRSILLHSSDGVDWQTVSQIYEGEKNDETDFEFLPDGRAIATARLEGSGSVFGDASASTLIAVASPPYESWVYQKSRVTRLDGPCLFRYRESIYAIGRYQASFTSGLSELGSIWSRKRTSLFLVEEDGLWHLTDLPSAGDTSYAGIVIRGDELYASYYTSRVDRDYPWIAGMFQPSNIVMARISLPAMARLAQEKSAAGA